jgi:hypothetical protein
MLQHCSTSNQSCQEQYQVKQRQEQIWAALEYEKAHLKQEIATVENFTMPFLDSVLSQQQQQQQQHAQQKEQQQQEQANNDSPATTISQQQQQERQSPDSNFTAFTK